MTDGGIVVQPDGAVVNLDINGNMFEAAIGTTDGVHFDRTDTSGGAINLERGLAGAAETDIATILLANGNKYFGTAPGMIFDSSGTQGTATAAADPVVDANIPVLLGDFVWDDTDGDGIQDGGETGVAGVRVDLSGDAAGTAFTDASGKYLFSVLPGSYTVTVTPPAGKVFAPKDAGGNDTLDSDVDTGTGAASVTVVAGGGDLTIDAGLVVLSSFVQLDTDVTIADPELDALNGGNGNYDGATLQLQRNGGANADDQYSNTGNLSTLTQGQAFNIGATTVGTVTTNSGGTLLLTFNSSATTALVNQTLQGITYENSTAPPSVQLDYTFNDGNTGSQGNGPGIAAGSVTVTNSPLLAEGGNGSGWRSDRFDCCGINAIRIARHRSLGEHGT